MKSNIIEGTLLYKVRRGAIGMSLATLTLVSLAACGGSTGSEAQPTSTSAPLPTATTVAQAPQPEPTPTEAMEVAMEMDAAANTPVVSDTPATLTPSSSGEVTGGTTVVEATLIEWDLTLSQSEVAAGKVTFIVTNAGQMRHNLIITDSAGQELIGRTADFMARQGPQTLEVDLQPGTYAVLCGLPGHAERGQQAELVVK